MYKELAIELSDDSVQALHQRHVEVLRRLQSDSNLVKLSLLDYYWVVNYLCDSLYTHTSLLQGKH